MSYFNFCPVYPTLPNFHSWFSIPQCWLQQYNWNGFFGDTAHFLWNSHNKLKLFSNLKYQKDISPYDVICYWKSWPWQWLVFQLCVCVVLICSSWYHLPSEKVLNISLNFVCYLMHINLFRRILILYFLLESNQNLVIEILFMRAV